MLIVSFTSIPPRFKYLGGIIDALANQARRPDRVELTIPKTYRRFPGERPALPDLPDWVDVFEVEHDFGPATKVLPAVQRWQGRDVDILYCDDDRPYDPQWAARLLAARKRQPKAALCERGFNIDAMADFPRESMPSPRAQRVKGTRVSDAQVWQDRDYRPADPWCQIFASEGHVDVMEGYGGVLIKPDAFHPDVFNDPDMIWTVDDIWLSGMAALQGTPVWATAEQIPSLVVAEVDRTAPLHSHTEMGLGRNQLNWLAAAWFRETYGIWS